MRPIACAALAVVASGQDKKAGPEYLSTGRLPHFAGRYKSALGERVEKPGKERLTIAGSLTAGGKTVPATIRWELPGQFRLDQTGGGRPILVNGPGLALGKSQAALDAGEEALAESLLYDRCESVLYGIATGFPARLIGEHVRQGRNLGPGYSGPYYDVVDIVAKADGRTTSPTRHKRFLFDSFTGLLQRVLYRAPGTTGAENLVETVFDQWTTIDGSPFPLVTERRVNGTVVMRFQASTHLVGAKVADGAFENP